MIKVSVIVPVYNVEEYLPKCLDSLVNQSLREIEIILINDGSPDNCQDIIDEYKKKDKRIISIIKENGGQASARNVGLRTSKGEFICFVDSDDFIELDMLEVLYNKGIQDESDIVICDYCRIKNNKKQKEEAFSTKGNTMFENYALNTSGPCWKIIKRKLLIDNKLFFPEGIIYEDYAIVPTYALFANKISYVNKPFYNYLIREGSTMTQKFNKKFYDIVTATDILYKNLEKYGFSYYEEYEYFIIKNIFREAYVRLKTFEEGFLVLDELSNWAKTNIPNWTKNKYFKNESFKERLFSYLIYKRQYKLLDFIHKLKGE